MMVTYIDPVTGGYTYIDGKLAKTYNAINKANRLLAQVIGNDLKNPTLGNPLNTTKNITPNDIINGINYSLNPLLSDGTLSNVTILKTVKTLLQRWKVEIEIFLPDQKDQITLKWNE